MNGKLLCASTKYKNEWFFLLTLSFYSMETHLFPTPFVGTFNAFKIKICFYRLGLFGHQIFIFPSFSFKQDFKA